MQGSFMSDKCFHDLEGLVTVRAGIGPLPRVNPVVLPQAVSPLECFATKAAGIGSLRAVHFLVLLEVAAQAEGGIADITAEGTYVGMHAYVFS